MFDRANTADPEVLRERHSEAIETLHERCGVYTNPQIAAAILDAVGWTARADLSRANLLEPAAGDGVFVIEAAKRLVRSFRARGIALSRRHLLPRIRAYEIHPREARRARVHTIASLCDAGVRRTVASACARTWIRTADFLLTKVVPASFTHVVGNPPYVRWSRVPKRLRDKYIEYLPESMARGDLSLPFLHRALESLQSQGRCGLLCSDRWRYMAYAERFRRTWLRRLEIESERRLKPTEAFVRPVSSYPSILIARRRVDERAKRARPAIGGKTLAELGCTIRVGPALGSKATFVVSTGDASVEARLLLPWIEPKDIGRGRVRTTAQRVVVMHRSDGGLIPVTRYPKLYRRLRRSEATLKKRYCVRKGGAPWYEPIDKVRRSDWSRPKIVLPEMAKTPRAAIDRSGAIPSHGVYAIFCPDDAVDRIYRRIRGPRLSNALKAIAPRVNGGYYRCYARFLAMMRV